MNTVSRVSLDPTDAACDRSVNVAVEKGLLVVNIVNLGAGTHEVHATPVDADVLRTLRAWTGGHEAFRKFGHGMPAGREHVVDVWAKRWDPETDAFQWKRFANHVVAQDFSPGASTSKHGVHGSYWKASLPNDWRPVYWAPIQLPEEAK